LATLERYAAWLERLSEEDRRRIEAAADRNERLSIIKQIKERQCVQHLPLALRKELDALPEKDRSARIAALCKEDAERRLALKRAVSQPARPAKPTRLSEFSDPIQNYYRTMLEPLLTKEEKERFGQVNGAPWPELSLFLLDMADKYPVKLPGPIGPRFFHDLP